MSPGRRAVPGRRREPVRRPTVDIRGRLRDEEDTDRSGVLSAPRPAASR